MLPNHVWINEDAYDDVFSVADTRKDARQNISEFGCRSYAKYIKVPEKATKVIWEGSNAIEVTPSFLGDVAFNYLVDGVIATYCKTPNQAREFAHAILLAANKADKK